MSIGAVGTQGAVRFTRTRGRTGGSQDYGLQYPSPFFDIAHTYLPATVKQMFRWCRYYFLVNPLINAVVFKMSEYPVTDVIFDTERPEQRRRWQSFLLEQLRYRAFQVEVGLDYHCYGNALVSIFYPFVKMLKCANCGFTKPAREGTYRFQNFRFHQVCEKCGHHGPAKAYDHYIKAPKGIRLLRWNPEDVDIQYNDLTGEYTYYYQIPNQLRSDILIGKKSTVETVPQLFIDALRLKKAVVFSRDNIYHFKRPTLAGKDRGWGTPMILPVMKDTFYLQILRKAQEAIALEHITPLRTIFPQAGSATSDPYCVSHDTLVETRKGLRPAGEVGVGDYLKSHAGRWRRVEEAVDRPVESGEDVYEFTVSGLSAFPFKVSEEHPLLGVRRPVGFRGYSSLDEPGWIDAKNVREGDFVCYPTRRITWDSLALDLHDYCPERAATEKYVYRRLNQAAAEIYEYFEDGGGIPSFSHGEKKEFLSARRWSEQDYANARAAYGQQDTVDRRDRYVSITPELAYLIGAYAAEGSPKSQLASLSLHANETEFMNLLDDCVDKLGFRPSSRSLRENSATYEINDVFLAALLTRSCGRGAQNKHLPREIVEAPLDIAMSAVRATFRGDGCSFCTDTRRAGLKTVSPQLAMDVRAILLSDGLIPTVQRAVPREGEVSKLPYYQVNLNGLQADVFEGAKAEKGYRQAFSRCGFIRDGYVYLRVSKKVAEPSVTIVRGFQIDGDKSFCVAGVATHNTSVNLQDWRDQISGEIQRWRSDNNYIPILPLPIGHQTIGGDGRALLLSQEIRVWSEHIVAGMGIPVELIFGGLSYSGSNVSLRMLENTFLGYLQDHLSMLRWVIQRTASWLGWSPIKARFKPFKMADDLQRKAYLFQLNQAGKLSDESLMADADFDSSKEDAIMERESTRRAAAVKKQRLQQAEIDGESQAAAMKWQLKLQSQQEKHQAAMQNEMMKDQVAFQGQVQNEMMQGQMAQQTGQPPPPPNPELQPSPRQPQLISAPPKEVQSPLTMRSVNKLPPSATGENLAGRSNVDLLLLGRQLADKISSLDVLQQPKALAVLRSNQPDLYDVVLGLMMSGSGGPARASAAAARPLPEQKPARRGPEAQLI